MACTKVTRKSGTFQSGRGERLLPEIPDDVTLNLIAPKLAWRDICILLSVNRQWLHAIQSQEVSNARMRSHSTETLVLLTHTPSDDMKVISLYAKKPDECFSEVLTIPFPPCEMDPRGPKCVFLEGKIYVLGGKTMGSANDEVYVMDLLGKKQWKRCARMITGRTHFGCGVSERNIYVFGGESNSFEPLGSSEVYDPKEDTWSPFTQPMTCLRPIIDNGGQRLEEYMEVYHPKKEKTRVVSPFRNPLGESFFLVREKLHSLNYRKPGEVGIYIHDAEENSWKHLHSFSLDGTGPEAFTAIQHVVAVPVDDELLAIVRGVRGAPNRRYFAQSLFRSTGFGNEKREIVWQKVQFSGPNLRPNSPRFMCSIQL